MVRTKILPQNKDIAKDKSNFIWETLSTNETMSFADFWTVPDATSSGVGFLQASFGLVGESVHK